MLKVFHDLNKIMVKLKCLPYLHNFKIFHCFKSFAVGKKAYCYGTKPNSCREV